ncbi:hypothetical protein GCM10010415_27850 [Streptomyces atrovirens]
MVAAFMAPTLERTAARREVHFRPVVGDQSGREATPAYSSRFFQGPTPSFPVVPRSSSGTTVTGSAPDFARTRT